MNAAIVLASNNIMISDSCNQAALQTKIKDGKNIVYIIDSKTRGNPKNDFVR